MKSSLDKLNSSMGTDFRIRTGFDEVGKLKTRLIFSKEGGEKLMGPEKCEDIAKAFIELAAHLRRVSAK